MGRSRVLSFMSTFGGPPKQSSGSNSPVPNQQQQRQQFSIPNADQAPANISVSDSPNSKLNGRQRADSRPLSMAGGYVGPQMDTQNAVPELLPIFNCLNSHSNKLYQEGYFLKLNDLDSQGRPLFDRSWTECFAQLVGTVLSLWDAAALDNASSDGEVPATFINLGDASIKMIETLETRSRDAQPLQNVLSISTAGKNRYLLHFSNVHALTQWTAGIRLAMFENSSLQETYTGALIGGKGRALNNIRTIMTQSKFEVSDWVRVRFGAGTPWRRCWCVINPPNEKEIAKAQKSLKKRSTYDRTAIPVLKGDVKFYEVKKITKKTQPIATITNAYSAYAIYPQSKALIDASTLIKIEGNVTIHTNPETRLESFIFVMPETHDAVSGFEMLLRFLFPIWDVFALYGRPQRLIPDTWNPKSLMFAMPKHDRWGYLDILDVNTLVTRPGSANWSESEWKYELKKLTAERIEKLARDPNGSNSRPSSTYGHAHRNSLPSRTAALKFADEVSMDSRTSIERDAQGKPRANNGANPASILSNSLQANKSKSHGRSISESVPNSPHRRPQQDEYHPSRLSKEASRPIYSSDGDHGAPPPPAHILPPALTHNTSDDPRNYHDSSEEEQRNHEFSNSEANRGDHHLDPSSIVDKPPSPVQPVAPPPAFSHQPGAKPQTRPYQSPELRRANSRMSSATLHQLAAAAGKQSFGEAGMGGGEQSFGSSVDAYNRSNPNLDRSSNETVMTASKSRSPSRFDAQVRSNNSATNLQAPSSSYSRSTSPLRQIAAMTPEEKSAKAYFPEDPFGSQYQQQKSATSLNPPLTPREKSMERPVSGGKISRKPVPPSPSGASTEFVPAAETSPTEAIRTRDVDDAIVHRMDTIHSKASTTSRRYSGDGSNYDSDSPEYDTFAGSSAARNGAHPLSKQRSGRMENMENLPVIEPSENWQIHGEDAQLPGYDANPNSDAARLRQPQLRSTSKSPERRGVGLSARNDYSPSRVADKSYMTRRGSPRMEPAAQLASQASYSRSESNENARFGNQYESDISGKSLTPEQFVHQKSAAARVPVYADSRQKSNSDIRHLDSQNSNAPPLVSVNSADWAQHGDQYDYNTSSHGRADHPPDYFRQANTAVASQSRIDRKPVSPGVPQRGQAGYGQQQAPNQGPYQNYPAQEYYQTGPSHQMPGQFPTSQSYDTAGWDHSQQQYLHQQQSQQNQYTSSSNQGYGPNYGRQTPQDYYR